MTRTGRYGYWVDIADDPDGHRRAVHTHTAAGVPAPRIHGIVGVPHPLRPEQRRAFDHAYYPGRCIVIPDGRPPGWQWRGAFGGDDEPARPAAVALGALRALGNIVRAVLVVAGRLAAWPSRRIIGTAQVTYRILGAPGAVLFIVTILSLAPALFLLLHALGAPW